MKRFMTLLILALLTATASAHVPIGRNKPANPQHCSKEYNIKGNGVSSKRNSSPKTGRIGKIKHFKSSVSRVEFKNIR
jgi:hypothetical protein